MTVQLRPYQTAARGSVAAAWEDPDRHHPLVVLPTGCGKTIQALSMVADVLASGGRVGWLAHRGELLTQPLRALSSIWPAHADKCGIVKAGRDDFDAQCCFISVATAGKKARRDRIMASGEFDLLVVDEAHHSVSKVQRAVIRALGKNRRLGLTATPHREDDKDLSELWDIAYAYPITQALREGWLVAPWASVVPIKEQSFMGLDKLAQLSDDEQGDALIAAHVVEHTVEALSLTHEATVLPDRDHKALIPSQGRRYFVFCASVLQCKLTAAALEAAGWKAAWASGETSPDDRERLLRALSVGDIEIICCPMIFTEGTDCPAVDGIVLARACASWSTYVQCVGRGLRLHDPSWVGHGVNALDDRYRGKRQCLLIDLVGVSEIHDLRFAPILIGGSRCPEVANGVHNFVDLDGKGECTECHKKVACFLNTGPHEWFDGELGRHCKHCGRPQCEATHDGKHEWQELAETQVCLGCGFEMKLPSKGLQRRKKTEIVDAKWLKVPNVSPETWAVDAGASGLVFVLVDRELELGHPYWIKKGGRKAWPLFHAPVPLDEVRSYPNNILQREAKVSSRSAEWRERDASQRQADRLEAMLEEITEPRIHRQAQHMMWAIRRSNGRSTTAGDAADLIARLRARSRALATGLVHAA